MSRPTQGSPPTRFVLALFIWGYALYAAGAAGQRLWPLFGIAAVVYFGARLATPLFSARRPGPAWAMLPQWLDLAGLAFLLAVTGPLGAPLFGPYLLLCVEAGLDADRRARAVSGAIAVGLLGLASLGVPFWTGQPLIALGLLATVLVALWLARATVPRSMSTPSDRHEREAAEHVAAGLLEPLAAALESANAMTTIPRLRREDRDRLLLMQRTLELATRRLRNLHHLMRVENAAPVSAQENLDLHRVLNSVAERAMRGAADKDNQVLLRISPKLPYRLVGDAGLLHDLLAGLVSICPPPGRLVIDATPARSSGTEVRVRFELRRVSSAGTGDRAVEACAQAEATVIARLVQALGGEPVLAARNGGDVITGFEIPLKQAPGQETATAEVAGRQLLVVSDQPEFVKRAGAALSGLGVRVISTEKPEEAIDMLARSIRIGEPVDAAVVHVGSAPDEAEIRRAGDLCEKAVVAHTPVYLAARASPPEELLRRLGYSGYVDERVDPEEFSRLIHSCAHWIASASSGVVRVEPWAWGQSSATPRRRILVVDDNRTNLLIVRTILTSAGYDVDIVDNGEEALERLLAGGYRAAILDMHMPRMDGVTLLRRYRMLRPWKKIPIAILTANTSFEATSECAEAGADAFLTKPVEIDPLLNTVEALIKDSEIVRLNRAGDSRPPEMETGNTERLIDANVVSELGRLYREPKERAGVFRAFCSETEGLLEKMSSAARAGDVSAFTEQAQALKASALNMGAVALAKACQQLEAIEPHVFRRDADRLCAEVVETCHVSLMALQEDLDPGHRNLNG